MLYQILNFWNYKSAIANVSALTPATAHSVHLPTLGFKEIITQVTASAPPWNSMSLISITPRISNDAQNWEKLTALTVGPITTPATTIFKQDEVGAFQDYEIDIATTGLMPFSYDSGLSFLIQALGRGGKREEAGQGAGFEEYIKYLDAVRRGERWGAAPGGGRLLEFFPRQFVFTSDNGSGQWQTVYTRPVSTHECDQVDVSLSVDSFIDSSGGGVAQMSVYPQISIDGMNWYELAGAGFTTINSGTSFPFLEHKLLETIGAFMRFSINFIDPAGMMAGIGANLEVIGCKGGS